MTKELEYGKWYPIEEYFRNIRQMDWALVQFKETKSGFMGLPHIAELRNNKWYIECDDEELYTKYINEDCEPIAFMLWKPYNEDSSLEAIENSNPSEAISRIEDCLYEDPYADRNDVSYENDIATIKQALLKSQEQEKVLEIIKEKGLPLVEKDMIKQSENYEQYCIKYSWCKMKNASIQKTEEEFELLKRYCDEI